MPPVMISSLSRPVILQVPVLRIDAADIAGPEPTAGMERLRGRGWIVAVAGEHLRAAQQDLAVATGGKRLAGLIGDRQLETGQRQADAAGQPRPVVGIGDIEAALGRSVALERDLARQLPDPLRQQRRQCRRAGHQQPQRAQLGACEALPVGQP